MAAYEGGSEPVRLGGEMGGDEGKNLQRDAIYGNEGIPPLADGRQRDRYIPVKLRNLVEREAIERVSMLSSCKTPAVGLTMVFRDVQRRIHTALQLFVQGEDEL